MAANMSRALRVRFIAAASLPVAGLQLLSTLKASSVKVHPRELDIYKEPEKAQFQATETEPTPLEENVSKVRKVVWKYSDKIKDTTARIKDTLSRVEHRAFEFVDLIQTDSTFQMKVGAISTGILTGTLLAGRGRRPFRRVFFATGLGTIAASICYPREAVDLSLTSFEKLKNFVNEQREKYSQKADDLGAVDTETVAAEGKTNSLDKATSDTNKAAAREIKEQERKDKVITVEKTEEKERQSAAVGDPGMSTPEDKDLYSTRS